ncbi:MAG TPA: hypothetical protein VIJ01_16300 [Candidatus Angelobacter sp.]
MRIAVAAMLFVFLGSSAFALGEDGRRPPASESTSTSASAAPAPASASAANAASTPNTTIAFSVSPAPAEIKPGVPLAVAPAVVEPAPATALVAPPPAAFVKLKTPPHTHTFFDARNTLGFATLGASLTADALSTQKGLAYPGFNEMNPIARPFVQSRMGAAVYNAGSFGLLAGLMYWAHKTEHHKLERILPFAVGGWEGLLSMRNYHVIANRAR